jgi:hypothetical protein
VTSLKIAFIDASFASASNTAARLQQSLTESGIDALVMPFDGVAPEVAIARFDAVFLRGLQQSAATDLSSRAADQALRVALGKAGAAYQVIYGNDDESLEQLMLAALKLCAPPPLNTAQGHRENRNTPWVWLCDKCSDSQCEHRLLSDLLAKRQPQLST